MSVSTGALSKIKLQYEQDNSIKSLSVPYEPIIPWRSDKVTSGFAQDQHFQGDKYRCCEGRHVLIRRSGTLSAVHLQSVQRVGPRRFETSHTLLITIQLMISSIGRRYTAYLSSLVALSRLVKKGSHSCWSSPID